MCQMEPRIKVSQYFYANYKEEQIMEPKWLEVK